MDMRVGGPAACGSLPERESHALLADFGIAKSAGADPALTGSGVVLGSTYYMSPEQAAAEKLDGRSDIYSLGAVAYEMLAGRRPFEAPSVQQLLLLQFTTEPPSLRAVAPDIPDAVSNAIMRALERDPAHRFASAGDFATALAAAGAPQESDRAEPSWFARRGLVVAAFYFVGMWGALISMPLMDSAAALDNKGMQLAISLMRAPLQLVQVGILYLVAEFFVIRRRLRRSGLSGPTVRQRLFLQPAWWQPWYPRSLRDQSNVWDRMAPGMKLLRTISWLIVPAGLFTVPLMFVVPELAGLASGQGLPLPLPVRITIVASRTVLGPMLAALFIVAVGVPLQAWIARVSPVAVLRLLFTWRAAPWDSPAGRRLQREATLGKNSATTAA